MQQSIAEGEHDWIELYRAEDKDPFTDKSSMLNQDMGVRAAHAVLNDLFFHQLEAWSLDDWTFGLVDKTSTTETCSSTNSKRGA